MVLLSGRSDDSTERVNVEPVGGSEREKHGKSKVEPLPEGQSREERRDRRERLGDLAAVLRSEEPQTRQNRKWTTVGCTPPDSTNGSLKGGASMEPIAWLVYPQAAMRKARGSVMR